jgi:Flp pilus assembly pilin Flp
MALEAAMSQWLYQFWLEEEGQDLIEYSLLITFIAIFCMWFVGAGRDPVKGIWTTANSTITVANTSAGGSIGSGGHD